MGWGHCYDEGSQQPVEYSAGWKASLPRLWATEGTRELYPKGAILPTLTPSEKVRRWHSCDGKASCLGVWRRCCSDGRSLLGVGSH